MKQLGELGAMDPQETKLPTFEEIIFKRYNVTDLRHVALHGDDFSKIAIEFAKLHVQAALKNAREIFKDPITDDGTKKSKKGLLQVAVNIKTDSTQELYCYDQQTLEQESKGLLTTVFKDGKLVKETTLDEIRNRLNGK